PCHLLKAIAQTPKLYSTGSLSDNKVNVHVHDSEEILKDAEKSRLKLKKKQNDDEVQKKKVTMFLIDYAKLNSLYETFVPQTELSLEQQYFSEASTSNVTPLSECVKKSDSPPPKMPKQSRVNRYFNALEYDVKRFDSVITEKTSINGSNFAYGHEKETREYFYKEVKPINDHLRQCVNDFQNEFTREVKEMIDIFDSMEIELYETLKKNDIFDKAHARLLEVIFAQNIENLEMHLCVENENENVRKENEKCLIESSDVQKSLLNRIKILENDF
ncbi:hypothetical protein Tco_0165356, partial [Tanacetum coccineum]